MCGKDRWPRRTVVRQMQQRVLSLQIFFLRTSSRCCNLPLMLLILLSLFSGACPSLGAGNCRVVVVAAALVPPSHMGSSS